jgi:wyosine [tRNA(Phe)-imidazoG37] synthetase (radical SAM superfamily)
VVQAPVKKRSSKYTYGPVPSRRLGHSLGIDIIPHKNCSFDCIYCQLGKTINKTVVREEYAPVEPILDEVRTVLKSKVQIDYLTFSGSGEPTLHKRIGYLINELKKTTEIPLAVLTNGSLLYMPDVRNDLRNADVVVPTLCTADQKVFQKIHRNHASLDIHKIIEGYIEFRMIYEGKIWLEVMLIKGINDGTDQIKDLKIVIDRINPDKIHLNTVVRPPSEEYVHPVSQEILQNIKRILGEKCEIVVDFKPKTMPAEHTDQLNGIAAIIARRPITIDDLSRITGLHKNEILKYIQVLLKSGKIEKSRHDQKEYYRILRRSDD